MTNVRHLEPWLTKRELAAHFACSGIVYGPRVLPIWEKVDGEWEHITDRIIGVVDFEGGEA